MPRKCCIPNCRRQQDDPGCLDLGFRLISNNPDTREKWINSILQKFGEEKRKEFDKKFLCVCDSHFEDNCFYYAGTSYRKMLLKESFPTLLSDFKQKESSTSSEPCEIQNSVFNVNNVEFEASVAEGANDKCIIFDKEDTSVGGGNDSPVKVGVQLHVENSDIGNIHTSSCKPSLEVDSNKSSNDTIESLSNIDIQSVDFSDIENVRKLLLKGQVYSKAKDGKIAGQYRVIKSLRMQLYRQRKRVKDVGSLMSHMKERKMLSKKILPILQDTVPACAHSIFERILHKTPAHHSRKAFPAPLKSFAATLHFYSAKAYNYVRSIFLKCLPHPMTLQKWYRKVHCSSGINNASITVIKRKINAMKKSNPNEKVLCNLVMDEMKIKKYVELVNGKEYGYVDTGNCDINNENLREAENVLVVMAVCENDHWKVPVSYYFVNALKGKEKAEIVKQNLTALHKTGITITSLTFDGLQSNLTMCTELGTNLSVITDTLSHSFNHPVKNEEVHIICDGCHILKLIRNAFATQNLHDSQGNLISWSHLQLLVNYQEKNELYLANKLSRSHLMWKQNIMNVKLAAQTCSNSVSTALLFLKNNLHVKEFHCIEGTAKFCSLINKGFDILNSRKIYTKDPSKKGICKDNYEEICKDVKKIIEYIRSLKTAGGTLVIYSKRKTGFSGMIIALKVS